MPEQANHTQTANIPDGKSDKHAASIINSNHPILDIGLKNLFRHDLRHHGDRYNLFCDAFPQFGVSFPALSAIGIGPVCPRATLSTYQISNPTLQLHLKEGDVSIAVQRQDLDCLPWLTIEETLLPVQSNILKIEAQHVFEDERTLLTRFTFSNSGDSDLSFEPRWCGRISGEHELYMLPYFHGTEILPRTPFLKKVDSGIIGGLKVSRADHDMPEVAVRLRCNAPAVSSKTEDGLSYSFFASGPIALAAGASLVFHFTTEVCIKNTSKKEFEFSSHEIVVDFDTQIKSARERFAREINLTKAPPTNSPSLEMKAWRARHALLRDGMRGLDGEFGDELACLCTSDNTDFSCIFFWDTLFSSVAISDFHKMYAKGAIRTAFVRSNERDGSSPERKYNYGPKGRMSQQSPQSPIASWAVLSYLEKHNDKQFLAEMFPTLVRNHEFWEKYSDTDSDGLAEYRWSGQVGDNSPLWDQYASLDPTTGCGYIPPVASVPLNSFLFWDANNLAQLAEMQGLRNEAIRFRVRAAQVQRDLFAICYIPGEKRFWDFNHHTGLHRKVNTFYMFWPLFAGMDVPSETAKDLIENVLLDPEQFFGEIPFPSVAYNESTYNSKGYWRGRSWPHISYWLLQMLVRFGYVKEAKVAAGRILLSYSRSAGFPENLASKPEHFDATGFADYNWGCAAVYLIATEQYLNVLPIKHNT